MRLIAYFLVVAVLVGGVGVLSYINTEKVDVEIEKVDLDIETIDNEIHKLDDAFELLLKHNIPELDSAARLLITLEKSRRTLHEYILGEAEAKQEFLDSIKEFDAHQDELKASLNAAAAAAAAAADIDKDLADLDVIIQLHEHFHEDGEKVIALLDAGKRDEAIAFLNSEVDPEIQEMQTLLEKFEEDAEREIKEWSELVDKNVHEVEELVEDADTRIHTVGELIHKTTNVGIVVSIIAIILSITLGLFVSQRITKPLKQLSKTVDEVSKGNFKTEVQKTSSIKEINQLTDSLDRIMTTMKLAVEEQGTITKVTGKKTKKKKRVTKKSKKELEKLGEEMSKDMEKK